MEIKQNPTTGEVTSEQELCEIRNIDNLEKSELIEARKNFYKTLDDWNKFSKSEHGTSSID